MLTGFQGVIAGGPRFERATRPSTVTAKSNCGGTQGGTRHTTAPVVTIEIAEYSLRRQK
jgi:hypothetical protein